MFSLISMPCYNDLVSNTQTLFYKIDQITHLITLSLIEYLFDSLNSSLIAISKKISLFYLGISYVITQNINLYCIQIILYASIYFRNLSPQIINPQLVSY
jgi:hypothetical protein